MCLSVNIGSLAREEFRIQSSMGKLSLLIILRVKEIIPKVICSNLKTFNEPNVRLSLDKYLHDLSKLA